MARAAVESIAFQVGDLLDAVQRDSGIPLTELRVDGGAAGNDMLMQFQADLLGVPVARPAVTETTALGAAYLAGLAVGFWTSTEEIARQWRVDRRFEPSMPREKAASLTARWRDAVTRSRGWVGPDRMNRDEMRARVARQHGPWDIVVIGGGATGTGIAVDAASRGYAVALVEQSDFGKGTSSRSTKLVHGGVRYLQQGNIGLVREALRERSLLRRNAPHVVTDLALLVPAYARWERAFYGAGLMAYDLLAGRSGFGRSALLSPRSTLDHLPTLNPDGLRGGVLYHDGQFDDARLLINLAQTAAEQGGVLLNYARVHGLSTSGGRVDGAIATDEETGAELRLPARVVINATGAFADGVRKMASASVDAMIAPSQGTHLVLDRRFLPGQTALMVPRVGDGRVMFAIPWRGHTMVGTTDTPIVSSARPPT